MCFICIFGLDGHKQSVDGLLTRRTDLHEAVRRNTKHIASVQFCVPQHKLTGKRWKLHETANCTCQRTGSGKTLAFAMPYLSMSRPDKMRDTIFAVRRPLQCQAWAARGFRAAMCFTTFRGHGAYKASCNVLQLSKIQNTSMHILISCRQFLQVHLWQGAGHADSRGALCFGVLADSHMLFHIQLTQ